MTLFSSGRAQPQVWNRRPDLRPQRLPDTTRRADTLSREERTQLLRDATGAGRRPPATGPRSPSSS